MAIGLMSGTSMDGIDCSLVKIKGFGNDTKIDLIEFKTYCYPEKLIEKLIEISQPGNGTVDQICCLNFVVGEYFADAALDICKQAGIKPSQIDIIGSHGQTIHHLPDKADVFGKSVRSTLQIGEPAVIANRAGIVTVANFRSADMAENGQGAPLIPYFDFLLFQSIERNRVVLNIGGIANFTILQKKCTKKDVLAYDTGPGNMVINSLMKKLFEKDFDESGKVASNGNVSEKLLDELKKHSYFNKPVPKSTGREEFGNNFVNHVLENGKELGLPNEDIIATVTELTAWSIADALRFSPIEINEVDELIVSGGGVYNEAIMKSLKEKFKRSEISTTEKYGIPSDAKEAICFAVLANETVSGIPSNLPSVTGANRPVILGTIAFG